LSSTSEVPEITDSGDDDLCPYTEDVTHSGIACLNSGMGESGDSALYSSIDAIESGDEGLFSKSIEVCKNKSVSDSISEHIDSGDADLFPVTISVVVSCCVYWGTGESGDRALNSSTDVVESGVSCLSSISEIRGVNSVSDSVSYPDNDSGDEDLYPIIETIDSRNACLNSGMGESGDSVLYSSIDTIESGDEGLSSKSIEAYKNNSFSNSSSDNTDAGDDDLLPVINMVGSGKYCRYCGRGESGDRHLNSSTDAVDSGEDDLTFVSSMTDSGDMGQYSDKDSGDRGLSSVSDTIDSGESGLDSIKNTSEMKRSYSISEVTDSGDEDLYPIEYVTDSGKSGLNSGMGESGDSALYSSTDAIDSGESGLCQKAKASDEGLSLSEKIVEKISESSHSWSDHTDVSDRGLSS
jgi:hypothetical protein